MTTHTPEISGQLEFDFPELPPFHRKGQRRKSKAKTCLAFPINGLSEDTPPQEETGKTQKGATDPNH